MNKKLMTTTMVICALLTQSESFGMELVATANKKQNKHAKSIEKLHQRFGGVAFPEELSNHILYGDTDDSSKDALQQTCWSLKQKLTFDGPNMDAIIADPLFRTSRNNLRYLAFNAAWNNNSFRLLSLLPKMEQPGYAYRWELTGGWAANFSLNGMVKMKMSTRYDEIAQAAKQSGCELDFHICSGWCNDLTMACYNKNSQSVQHALENNKFEPNDIRAAFLIAIDRNSPECMAVLSPHIEMSDLRTHQDILEVAMKNKKYAAFEFLVRNEKPGYLNIEYSTVDSVTLTPFDWISLYGEQTGDTTFVDICRKLGGKKSKKLVVERCVIS